MPEPRGEETVEGHIGERKRGQVKLAVRDAQVKTASVEVKSLTISGKQVTLAVFRQLEEEPLIGELGEFLGLPWGRVNYHPDKCGSNRDGGDGHIHVVWQKGEELRRAYVKPPRFRPFGSEATDALLAADCQVKLVNSWWTVVPPKWAAKVGSDEAEFELDGLRCTGIVPSLALHGELDRVRKEIEECNAQRQEIFALASEQAAAEKRRRDEIKRRWDELQLLPQLFIAV